MANQQSPPSSSESVDSAALQVPPEPPPYPTIRQAITLLVLLVLVQGFFGIVIGQVTSLADFGLDSALLIGAANLLSFGLILWLAVRAARKISVSRSVGTAPDSIKSARTRPGPTEGN